MDTTKLAVGQKVWMQSGPCTVETKVVEITEHYMAVGHLCGRYLVRFGPNGEASKGWDDLGLFYDFGIGMDHDARIPGTKYGPWELVEAPEKFRTPPDGFDPADIVCFL